MPPEVRTATCTRCKREGEIVKRDGAFQVRPEGWIQVQLDRGVVRNHLLCLPCSFGLVGFLEV